MTETQTGCVQGSAGYTRPKTVRFTEDTFQLIVIGARQRGVTTSEYIRSYVTAAVAKIEQGTLCDSEKRLMESVSA